MAVDDLFFLTDPSPQMIALKKRHQEAVRKWNFGLRRLSSNIENEKAEEDMKEANREFGEIKKEMRKIKRGSL